MDANTPIHRKECMASKIEGWSNQCVNLGDSTHPPFLTLPFSPHNAGEGVDCKSSARTREALECIAVDRYSHTILTFVSLITEAMAEDDDKKNTKKPAEADDDDDDDDSAVDLEGMDLEDDDEQVVDEVEVSEKALNNADTMDEVDEIREHEDHDEMEEARKERLELMAAEVKEVAPPAVTASDGRNNAASVEEQLQYLLGQSEVFAHFLAGTFRTLL